MVVAIDNAYVQRQGDPNPAEMGYPGVWENKGLHNVVVGHPFLLNKKGMKKAQKEAKKKGVSLEQLYLSMVPAYLWKRIPSPPETAFSAST